MAKYDPNWLMKAKAKQWKQQEKSLSHIINHKTANNQHPSGLCGRGWGAKGHPSITTVQFPSVKALPSCYTCRTKFLESIGVEYNESGYPLNLNK